MTLPDWQKKDFYGLAENRNPQNWRSGNIPTWQKYDPSGLARTGPLRVGTPPDWLKMTLPDWQER